MRPVYSQDSYTVGTVAGAAVDMSQEPCKTFSLQVKGAGSAPTSWTVYLQGTNDGSHWFTLATHASGVQSDGDLVFAVDKNVQKVRSYCNAVSLNAATALVATLVGVA